MGKDRGTCLEAALDCEEQLKWLWLLSPLSLQHCCSGFPEVLPASPISPCTETRSPAPTCPNSRMLCCSRRGIYLKNIFSRNSKEETGQLRQNVQVQGQLAQESQVEKVPVCWCPSWSDIPSPGGQEDSPADWTASNVFATLSWILIFLESPSKGGKRVRCIGGAEEGSGEKSGENHPEMPSQTHPLPQLIFFLFFSGGNTVFSSQLYSWVIVQSSANGLCQAVVTLRSYWKERWQVGKDYKGTLHDIFWWADYSEISQELKCITLFWDSQPCQHTGQLTWAAAFSPSQSCWPAHQEPDVGIGQGFSAAIDHSDSERWGVDRRTQRAGTEIILVLSWLSLCVYLGLRAFH